VNISWQTDELAKSEVVYATESGFNYLTSKEWAPMGGDEDADLTEHSVNLCDLNNGTFYFVVVSTDLSGNVVISEENSFIYNQTGSNIFNAGNTSTLIAHNQINQIIKDGSDNIWLATSGGVSTFDRISWINYTIQDGLADNYVISAFADKYGNFWFGTTENTSRFDGANWTTFNQAKNVLSFYQDGSDRIWMGTDGSGVAILDDDSWLYFSTADGLAGNSVRWITGEGTEKIWLATDSGVSSYDGTDFITISSWSVP